MHWGNIMLPCKTVLSKFWRLTERVSTVYNNHQFSSWTPSYCWRLKRQRSKTWKRGRKWWKYHCTIRRSDHHVCGLMTLRFYGSWHTVNVISFALPKHTPHAYGKTCRIAQLSVWLFFPLLWTRHFVSRSLY